MSDRRFGRHGRWKWIRWITLATGWLLISSGTSAAAAAAFPVLPDADWSPILGALYGPSLTPGESGAIAFQVGNPLTNGMAGGKVYLQVYAFNPTDGGAPQAPPVGSSPTFGPGALGYNATPPVLAHGARWNSSVPVTVPATAPTGDYAVRISVSFTMNSTAYLLESRGFFSASAWASATQYANGTPTINASRLGVSGVVPETSILVRGSSTPVALFALLAAGLGLAGLGAYWWTRSEAKSKAGTRRSSPPHSAPTAFGIRRSSDGD